VLILSSASHSQWRSVSISLADEGGEMSWTFSEKVKLLSRTVMLRDFFLNGGAFDYRNKQTLCGLTIPQTKDNNKSTSYRTISGLPALSSCNLCCTQRPHQLLKDDKHTRGNVVNRKQTRHCDVLRPDLKKVWCDTSEVHLVERTLDNNLRGRPELPRCVGLTFISQL